MPEIPAHYSNRRVFPASQDLLRLESGRSADEERFFAINPFRPLVTSYIYKRTQFLSSPPLFPFSPSSFLSSFLSALSPFLFLFPYLRLIEKLAGFNSCKQRNKRNKEKGRKEKNTWYFRIKKSLASSRLIIFFILGYFGRGMNRCGF